MQKDYVAVVREFVEVTAPKLIEEGKRFYSPEQYKNFVQRVQSQVEGETYIGFAAAAAENLTREVPMAFRIMEKVENGKVMEANVEYSSMPFMDRIKIYELLEESYYALDLIDSLKLTMASSLEGVYPENSPTQIAIIKNETRKLEKAAKKNKAEGTELQQEKESVAVAQPMAN